MGPSTQQALQDLDSDTGLADARQQRILVLERGSGGCDLRQDIEIELVCFFQT
jgi:hypothetical protein